MPAKRALNRDNDRDHPASKIPAPARNHKTPTGAAHSRSGKTPVAARKKHVPQTELEKLESFRSKLEQSMDAFIRARKELQEIISAEGSSEQGHFFTESSADLRTELKRQRELMSRIASLKGNQNNYHNNHHRRGPVKTGSSYEFLKSIVG